MSTGIGWTDETWNPLRAVRDARPELDDVLEGSHCERVSAGCQNCYAETLNRTRRWDRGTGLGYNRASRDKVTLYVDDKTLAQPLHWTKPRMVFVCSMTDLFGEWVTDDWIYQVFAVMAMSPKHTFQVLSKRPERMLEILSGDVAERVAREMSHRMVGVRPPVVPEHLQPRWPLPNVWFGISAENQEAFNDRWAVLNRVPAAKRWVSFEPLLGPIHVCICGPDDQDEACALHGRYNHLDWAVVGGETGAGRRGMELPWLKRIVTSCETAKVPVFVKQDSAFRSGQQGRIPDDIWAMKRFPKVSS